MYASSHWLHDSPFRPEKRLDQADLGAHRPREALKVCGCLRSPKLSPEGVVSVRPAVALSNFKIRNFRCRKCADRKYRVPSSHDFLFFGIGPSLGPPWDPHPPLSLALRMRNSATPFTFVCDARYTPRSLLELCMENRNCAWDCCRSLRPLSDCEDSHCTSQRLDIIHITQFNAGPSSPSQPRRSMCSMRS